MLQNGSYVIVQELDDIYEQLEVAYKILSKGKGKTAEPVVGKPFAGVGLNGR